MTIKHRMSGSPEWLAWKNAIDRCHNPNHFAYKNYGGRGIRVCWDWNWSGGFAVFFAHIGPKPSPQHTLDRIDNSRGYEPGNVRWASRSEQARNTRRAVWLDGKRLSEWAEKSGLSRELIAYRMKAGWTPQDAVTLPAGEGTRRCALERARRRCNAHYLTIDGERMCVSAWAERSPVSLATIYGRLRRGWENRRAVFAPLLPGGRPRPQGDGVALTVGDGVLLDGEERVVGRLAPKP